MTDILDKRILFVDDEPNVLTSIRRGLRKQTDKWAMTFAADADQAMQELSEQKFDIVVSDVTMPKVDGVAFLQQVRNQYPDTVRILMSGTAHGDVLMRAVPVAHRFLSKPWNIQSLTADLTRAFELRDFMRHTDLRKVVGSVSSLPILPTVYQELCATLENPNSRLDDVVAVVDRDPGVVARLLHIVNSAFFAAPRPMHNTTETIRYLGTSLLKSLLLTSEIFSRFDESKLPRGFGLTEMQNHALLTAKLASRFTTEDRDMALSAGLLHSIGKLIFADRMAEEWSQAYLQSKDEGRTLVEVEMEHFNTNYAQVGGYLLGLWGLPQEMVEAIADHSNPSLRGQEGVGLVGITHVASVLAAEQLNMNGYAIDSDFLASNPDVEKKLEKWRSLAARITE